VSECGSEEERSLFCYFSSHTTTQAVVCVCVSECSAVATLETQTLPQQSLQQVSERVSE
jgi:hypothetical protein